MTTVYKICPHCHSAIEFNVEEIIYSTSKSAILDYSLFVANCPVCRTRVLGDYPCYYCDHNGKYIVKVGNPEQKNFDERKAEYNNFRRYEVSNTAGLVEVIQFIDAGEKDSICYPCSSFLHPGKEWDEFVVISNKDIIRGEKRDRRIETAKERQTVNEETETNEPSAFRETCTAILGLTGMILLLPVVIVLLLAAGWVVFTGIVLGSCLLALPFAPLWK